MSHETGHARTDTLRKPYPMSNPTSIDHLERIRTLTREAVLEVFQSMLSLDVGIETSPAALPPDPEGEVIGSVGFIGEATGVICLNAEVGLARTLTSRLLGIPPAEVDNGDMLNDVIGELSNMVAGYVKSRLCDGGLSCTLTIPSIVRGQQLSVEGPIQVTRTVLGFRTGNQPFLVEILFKEPEPEAL
jgi:CheY-specific phosphatase CheX